MADRLISVPAARSHIDAVVADPILKACMHNVLDGLPAADAVEVVRCKDCKYRFKNNGHNKHGCPIVDANIWMDDDSFCSFGERRCENG